MSDTSTRHDALDRAFDALEWHRRRDIAIALGNQAERAADRHDLKLAALWSAVAELAYPPDRQAPKLDDSYRPRLQG